MDNQQDYDLTLEQQQVLLTGTFGNGCIREMVSGTSIYKTNCIYEDYMFFKYNLLGNLVSGNINKRINMGYKRNYIYTLYTKHSLEITKFNHQTLEEKLKLFTELGLALWFYDDGSLHKNKNFYNLNTQKFSQEVNEEIIKPYFESLGLRPKVLKEIKKDGRIFFYLYFKRHSGAYEITKILEKYPIDCFKYKLWSSTTTQKWGKLQAELKSKGISVTNRKFANMLLEMQDIV